MARSKALSEAGSTNQQVLTEQAANASQMLGGAQRPPLHPPCFAVRDFSGLGPTRARAPVEATFVAPKAFFNASGLGSFSSAPVAAAPPMAFFNAAGLKPSEGEVLRGNSNASAEARANVAAETALAAKKEEQRQRIMKILKAQDADIARAQQRAQERKAELDAEKQIWGDNYPLHQEIEMAHQSFLHAVDHLTDNVPQQQVETFIEWFKESVKTRSKSSNNSEVNACVQMVREIKQSFTKLSADCTLAQQEARALHAPQNSESFIFRYEYLVAQHQEFYKRFADLEKEMKSLRAAITAAKPIARNALNPTTLSSVVPKMELESMTKEELVEALAVRRVKTTGMNRANLQEALETALALDAIAGHSLDAKKKAVKRSVLTLPSTLFAAEGSSHDKHDIRDVLRERGSQEVIRERGTKVVRERSTKGDFE